jgi:hypothetical protein
MMLVIGEKVLQTRVWGQSLRLFVGSSFSWID